MRPYSVIAASLTVLFMLAAAPRAIPYFAAFVVGFAVSRATRRVR